MRPLFVFGGRFLIGGECHDPAGFRVDLPDGWQSKQQESVHFMLNSPDPGRYVLVQSVFNRSGSPFPGLHGLEISSARRSLS